MCRWQGARDALRVRNDTSHGQRIITSGASMMSRLAENISAVPFRQLVAVFVFLLISCGGLLININELIYDSTIFLLLFGCFSLGQVIIEILANLLVVPLTVRLRPTI